MLSWVYRLLPVSAPMSAAGSVDTAGVVGAFANNKSHSTTLIHGKFTRFLAAVHR
jgi:hypothetical protein